MNCPFCGESVALTACQDGTFWCPACGHFSDEEEVKNGEVSKDE